MQYQTFDRFYPRAQELRSVFDRRFADPLRTSPERFVWDYWHVPGEYTLLRTPAYNYFPRACYERFHRYLVRWGREVLGCHDISPPWLSCYIEGCRQFPHRDVPHGPLAFVYSLTPRRRQFTGGETFIEKPRVSLPPNFNRLTIFNPSLLHGVREVRGTHDPRQGRLVIHGWFVNPRPFWVGPLTVEQVRQGIEAGWVELPLLAGGLLSLRLKISAKGQVRESRVLMNSLRDARDLPRLQKAIESWTFARHRAGTVLTLPLLFNS